MVDDNNPAGRLYKLLSEAKKLSDKITVAEAWSKVIGCENDPALVTQAVVQMYSLSQEIRSLICMRNDLVHNAYLHSFDKLEQAFFPLNLGANWEIAKQYLTDEALARLEFCAIELSKSYSEELLSIEDLQDIINRTDSLFDSLYKSSLPDPIRLILLEEIERIRNALNMYKITGAKGLKQALQGTIGAVVANNEELKTVSTGPNTDVIQRLGELLDKLDSFTSRAMKLKRILEKPIISLLEFIKPETESDENIKN